ncbi:MAG: ATP-binding protein, partial [Pseudobdellovibrionaceae bacterium]|nr:ATP-binding protein [Pseudobdellovibrionaceae bacterium]
YRGESQFNIEFRIIHWDGRIRYILANLFVERSQDGIPSKVVGVDCDVTELRNAQLKHQRPVDHAPDTVSKVEAGKLEVELGSVDLARILAEVKDHLSEKVAEKRIRLDFVIEGQVPTFIQTDPLRLKQILLNIIGNSIKFTDHGHVSLTIKLLPASDETSHTYLAFVVSDTGIGMTPEEKERIFKAFSQADNSISRRFGGTGLGLSISLGLAQLLGGDIVVSNSEPGKGSTFTVTINPLPADLYSLYLPLYQISSAFLIELGFWVVIRAWRMRLDGSLTVFLGGLGILFSFVYDILVIYGILPRPFTLQYAATLYVFLASKTLAQQFAKAFRTAEKLQKDLKKEVVQQTAEIKQIMASIPQGIFTMGARLCIEGLGLHH